MRYARANPVPWEMLAPLTVLDAGAEITLSDRKPGTEAIVERSIHIDIQVGFTAAISFEEQPAGLCRHLSWDDDSRNDMCAALRALATKIEALNDA